MGRHWAPGRAEGRKEPETWHGEGHGPWRKWEQGQPHSARGIKNSGGKDVVGGVRLCGRKTWKRFVHEEASCPMSWALGLSVKWTRYH